MKAATLHASPGTQATDYLVVLGHGNGVRDVGGKAFNLCRMLDLGIDVPPGLVVTTGAFEAFIAENGLRGWIDERCAGLHAGSPRQIGAEARSIRERILQSRLPDVISKALAVSCQPYLENGPLIVRSSGVGEDSENASFAGQLDSFGNIDSLADVESALLECWASYWSERSLFYQLSRGTRLEGMGVVIQQQIGSVVSGILFTVDPSGHDDGMLLEYCAGPGENLSSGRETPVSVRIPRDENILRLRPDRNEVVGAGPAAGVVLDDEAIWQIANIGLQLENAFGQPQDIEWTMDASRRLHVVQSRPVTAGQLRPTPSRGSAQPAIPADKVVWSNANINENFPEPVSPFLYSIASRGYYHYFRNLALAFGISKRRVSRMEEPLRNIIGVHAGRLYYNLTNIHAVLRMAPFGDALAAAFNEFVGADTDTSSPQDASTWANEDRGRIAEWFEAAKILARVTWLYLGLSRRVESFEKTVADFSGCTRPDELPLRTIAELQQHVDEFVDIRCNRWLGASLADTSAMVCHGLLKLVLGRRFSASEEAALHNTLLKGLPNLVSAEPANELWRLSRRIRSDAALLRLFEDQSDAQIWRRVSGSPEFHAFYSAVVAFLENWGFRFSGELMLTIPSYQENPAGLMSLLRTYVTLDGDSPVEVMREQAAARERRTMQVLDEFRRRKVLRYLPGRIQAFVVGLVLAWTQRSIVLRERARLKQALLYSRCRRILLAIGDRLVVAGHLEKDEDVFWLAREELADAVAGRSHVIRNIAAMIARRRDRAERWRSVVPPDRFELDAGECFRDLGDRPGDSSGSGHDDTDVELCGIGACGGVVTGTAQPIRDLNQSHLLSPGDVLVTRQTDPGWGPLFFIASGLVLERGGMLSHGAILAREYGLPCVVAVERALERIAAGQTITVDGDREIVRIVH